VSSAVSFSTAAGTGAAAQSHSVSLTSRQTGSWYKSTGVQTDNADSAVVVEKEPAPAAQPERRVSDDAEPGAAATLASLQSMVAYLRGRCEELHVVHTAAEARHAQEVAALRAEGSGLRSRRATSTRTVGTSARNSSTDALSTDNAELGARVAELEAALDREQRLGASIEALVARVRSGREGALAKGIALASKEFSILESEMRACLERARAINVDIVGYVGGKNYLLVHFSSFG
jgi:hypothetical protein